MDENTIVMHGREFHLETPSVGVTIRILNCIGSLGARATRQGIGVSIDGFGLEEMIGALVNGVAGVAFGLMSVLTEHDLLKLGSAVLQFEDDREGRQWLMTNGLLITPIVKALMINVRLSYDLREAIPAFFDGIAPLIEKLSEEGESLALEDPEDTGDMDQEKKDQEE